MGKVTLTWDGSATNLSTSNTVQIQVTNLTSDTYVIEGSIDGNTWVTLQGSNMNTGVANTTISANGMYQYTATAKMRYTKTGTTSNSAIHLLRK